MGCNRIARSRSVSYLGGMTNVAELGPEPSDHLDAEELEARAAALDAWRSDSDPDGLFDMAILREAAGLAPILSVDGPRFDAASFRELAEFIAEMPF